MTESFRVPPSPRPTASNQASVARALALLRDIEVPGAGPTDGGANFGHLLDRIDALAASPPPPIRTIHHLSCTGGTLITKCIAAMPNVLVLNEIDPLGPVPFRDGRPDFTPTDLVALVRQGDTRISDSTIVGLFVEQLRFLRDDQARHGRALILRDHSHSHFLRSRTIPNRPSMRDILSEVGPTLSVVTVRNPLDSYLSLVNLGWHVQFQPSTFDEYCRRYMIFLTAYADLPILHYEAFIASPKTVMQEACRLLSVDYNPEFDRLFTTFQFSGDSGRAGEEISPRKQRPRSREFLDEVGASAHFQELKGMLPFYF